MSVKTDYYFAYSGLARAIALTAQGINGNGLSVLNGTGLGTGTYTFTGFAVPVNTKGVTLDGTGLTVTAPPVSGKAIAPSFPAAVSVSGTVTVTAGGSGHSILFNVTLVNSGTGSLPTSVSGTITINGVVYTAVDPQNFNPNPNPNS